MNKISIDDLKGFSTYSKIRETINDLIDEVELLKEKVIKLEEANEDLEETNNNLKEILKVEAQIKNAYR